MLGLRKRNINAKNRDNRSGGLDVIVGDTKCWTLYLKLRPQFTRSIIITFITSLSAYKELRFLKINSLHNLLLFNSAPGWVICNCTCFLPVHEYVSDLEASPGNTHDSIPSPVGSICWKENVKCVLSHLSCCSQLSPRAKKCQVKGKRSSIHWPSAESNSFTILNAGWSRNMLLTSIVQALQLTRKWAAAQQGLSWVLDIPQICCLVKYKFQFIFVRLVIWTFYSNSLFSA